MPRLGFMLKDDICFVDKFLMDGNEVRIYHPGTIDEPFLTRLKEFMDDFEYKFNGSWHYYSEDFTLISFSFEGELEH
jgi:hypothetical protein